MEKERLKELPIGRQTFSELIEQDLLYVDKTRYLWELVRQGKYYFLSRPRRFGKSLLLSTLKSFFEGRGDLFRGLYIHDKVKEWKKHPIIHIDYSLVDYRTDIQTFKKSLLNYLIGISREHQLSINENIIHNFFSELVRQLAQRHGSVVVLVDEYDKPLVDTLAQPKLFEENREVLSGLYGSMKALDAHLRFVMLTGVSRFSKVGVFSGMNNLDDISLNDTFASIVGFSQEELEHYFEGYLESLDAKFGLSKDLLFKEIKHYYNGFSWDGKHRLYNPFSILKLLKDQKFDNYWFATGTPTFLVNLIKKEKSLPETFENYRTNDLTGSSLNIQNIPLIPLLFQTGYLTISHTEKQGFSDIYFLNYPNEEVRHSFLTYLVASFVEQDEFDIRPQVLYLRDALIEEDIPAFLNLMNSFLADIPSQLHIPKEAYYHSLIGMMLRLVGVQPIMEKSTSRGRIDVVLELYDLIYIIEVKFATNKRTKRIKTLTRQALKQIEEKKYYESYLSSHKKIILLGIGFLDKKLDGKYMELPLP